MTGLLVRNLLNIERSGKVPARAAAILHKAARRPIFAYKHDISFTETG
jgi:hypothetical protein